MMTKFRMSRREATKLLGAAVAGAAALPLGAPAVFGQSTMAKLRIGTNPILDSAPMYAAIKNGYFAAERIEVEVVPGVGGAAALPAVAAGQLQLATSNIVTLILAANQGIGFQIVTGGAGVGTGVPNEMCALMARKGSGLGSGASFAGRRVAVNTRNNINWLALRMFVDGRGGHSDRVNILEIPFPQMADALLNNRVDAATINEPYATAAMEAGGGKLEIIAWPFSEALPNSIISCYAAMGDYISSHAETIAAVSRAYNRGIDWVHQNLRTPAWEELVVGYTRLPPSRVKSLLAIPSYEKTIDPKNLDRAAKAMKRYGLLDKIPDAKSMIYKTAVA